ncbi:hypothetical protein Pan44_22720 [Caulifigura coniformis]|uniref:Uncharacterized protein n=1 Tax=Caulifigura coniformis TaxID=2527983 RepID=A0A517SDP2_9PLAN|nr:hypothetical protein [Caulifigura coniformis]QDT54244.1 hypothetical protein Pan44_22720 [Caulifigura coniformis]
MKAACCCNSGTPEGRRARSRAAAPVSGLVCGAFWLLCPKCPACVAAYAALVGGITLSLPVAAMVLSGLRVSLITATLMIAAVFAWRCMRSLVR